MTTTEKTKGRDSGKSATHTTDTTTKSKRDSSWNAAKTQCARLLAALMIGPVTTIEARRDLDIISPAPRVHTLRHKLGKNILTTWLEDVTGEGGRHRVARYVLLDGANGGAA